MPASVGPSREATDSPISNFVESIEESRRKSQSRIVLALDLKFRTDISNLAEQARAIVSETSRYVCAFKFNFHLILPLSLNDLKSVNDLIHSSGTPSIADIKLNDIGSTNEVATEYLWSAGFSAVIVNPFAGYEGSMDTVLKRAHELGKGVITLTYMSHKGAEEGYGLELYRGNTLFDLFLERAKKWRTDGIVVGSTRPDKIREARKKLGPEMKIFSPGSGAQGGDPLESIRAGSDFLIIGRSIIESKDVKAAARQAFQSLEHSDSH